MCEHIKSCLEIDQNDGSLPCRDLRSLDYLVYPIEDEEVNLLFSTSPYMKDRDLLADSFIIQQEKKLTFWWVGDEEKQRLEIRSTVLQGGNEPEE